MKVLEKYYRLLFVTQYPPKGNLIILVAFFFSRIGETSYDRIGQKEPQMLFI